MDTSSINMKHERYLEAKRAGKSIEECVKAALPGTEKNTKRFKWWLENAETEIPELKLQIEFEELNKPKKTTTKKPAAGE